MAVDEHEQPAVQVPTRSLQEAAVDVILGGPRHGEKRSRCDVDAEECSVADSAVMTPNKKKPTSK